MNRLFIIGNGFDIHHGINSRYSDFLQYVNLYHHDDFHRIGKMFGDGNPSYLWSDFESNLGCFDVDRAINKYIDSVTMLYGKDSVQNIDKVFENLDMKNDTLHSDLQWLFRDWITDCILPISANKIYELNKNDLYLNFNYTPLLEQIYEIPCKNICYIHRNISKEGLEMPIFGHGLSEGVMDSKLNLNPSTTRKLYDLNILPDDIKQIYKELIMGLRKKTENIIFENRSFFDYLNPNQVYILGHSLGDADREYFTTISSTVQRGASIHVSYHSESTKEILKRKAESYFGSFCNVIVDRIERILPKINNRIIKKLM